MEDWQDAYVHLDRVIEILPETSESWPAVVSRQIIVLGHLERYNDARRLYSQASRRSPANRERFASAYEGAVAIRLRYLIEEEEYVKLLAEMFGDDSPFFEPDDLSDRIIKSYQRHLRGLKKKMQG